MRKERQEHAVEKVQKTLAELKDQLKATELYCSTSRREIDTLSIRLHSKTLESTQRVDELSAGVPRIPLFSFFYKF